MAEYEIQEIDLNDLMGIMGENIKKDIKNYEDLINLDGSLNREVYLSAISDGVGSTIEGYIRFFNKQDERNNVPVEKRKPILLYIDSIGGSLIDTLSMIDAIEMSRTPVYTIAVGACYSGGFFTFIAGHKRFSYPHASFLYHEGSTGTTADASKFRNFADYYEVQLGQLKAHVLKHSNWTEEHYEKVKRDDVWMTAKEMVDAKMCDEILKEFI